MAKSKIYAIFVKNIYMTEEQEKRILKAFVELRNTLVGTIPTYFNGDPIVNRVLNEANDIVENIDKDFKLKENILLDSNLGFVNAMLNPSEDVAKVENIAGKIYISLQKSISDT